MRHMHVCPAFSVNKLHGILEILAAAPDGQDGAAGNKGLVYKDGANANGESWERMKKRVMRLNQL